LEILYFNIKLMQHKSNLKQQIAKGGVDENF
jgi:hypothetical protein